MNFNLDRKKQAQEVIFFREIKNTSQPLLNFSNMSIKQVQFQKHFGVYLKDKLDCPEHLQKVFKKANKTVFHFSNKLPYLKLYQYQFINFL